MENASIMMEQIMEIARGAGKILLGYYRSGDLGVTIKEDLSPVTQADIASNDYICESLEKSFKVSTVSEESEVAYEERKDWEEFFLIDPLDGTKDFIAGNDEFTINIALIKDRRPVLGAIYVPALDELFYGEEGKGAYYLRAGDGPVRLPMYRLAEYTIARSWHHDSPAIERFARLNAIAQSRTMSSAIRFPRLAQGVVNVYAGLNRSKEWDTAAGHVLGKESGCRIVDLATRAEPVYNKPDIENNPFVACSGDVDLDKLVFPEDAGE
ncbi:MAG: 3'(2'),5'-bisphosphate nucleotidase CysQ [Nitrospinae bacterium]|nr:3'(2'),5'-bisphosphate nucleotidase CysQ [Nitrospinota bacterium]